MLGLVIESDAFVGREFFELGDSDVEAGGGFFGEPRVIADGLFFGATFEVTMEVGEGYGIPFEDPGWATDWG